MACRLDRRPYSVVDIVMLRQFATGQGTRAEFHEWCERHGRSRKSAYAKLVGLRGRQMTYAERKRWTAS